MLRQHGEQVIPGGGSWQCRALKFLIYNWEFELGSPAILLIPASLTFPPTAPDVCSININLAWSPLQPP